MVALAVASLKDSSCLEEEIPDLFWKLEALRFLPDSSIPSADELRVRHSLNSAQTSSAGRTGGAGAQDGSLAPSGSGRARAKERSQ